MSTKSVCFCHWQAEVLTIGSECLTTFWKRFLRRQNCFFQDSRRSLALKSVEVRGCSCCVIHVVKISYIFRHNFGITFLLTVSRGEFQTSLLSNSNSQLEQALVMHNSNNLSCPKGLCCSHCSHVSSDRLDWF